MKEYIERVLHQKIQLNTYEENDKLPLIIQKNYCLFRMTVGGCECILASAEDHINFAMMRKQQRQIERMTGLPCVLFLSKMNYYARDKMIREGIPFVWDDHQVYLPFIGILLDHRGQKNILVCEHISFLTQKILLLALYRKWEKINVTKAAELLGVTKTSISRCYDELEALGIPILSLNYRSRQLNAPESRKEMWEIIYPYLRSPVIRTYFLKNSLHGDYRLGGLDALSHYSQLGNGEFPIYDIYKRQISKLHFTADKLCPSGELPGSVVQETGYQIDFEDGKAMDPLSVLLSLSEEEKDDPRISMAVDEMLEEYVW